MWFIPEWVAFPFYFIPKLLICWNCHFQQIQCIWNDCRWSLSPLPGTKSHKKKPSHDLLVFSTSFSLHFFPAFLMFILSTHQTEDFNMSWTPRLIPLFWVTMWMVVRRESQSKSRLMLGGPEAPVTERGTWEVILKSSLGVLPPLFSLCPYSFLSSAVLELIFWEWGNRILLMVEFQKTSKRLLTSTKKYSTF